MGATRVALLFCVLVAATAAQRDSVAFDFGWKHRTGLTHTADPDSEPPNHPDPGLHPNEAAPGYADGNWLDVQLPHDGLIAATPSQKACPDGCSGRSYIPRHVLWYRKTFTLPADWSGSAVWLDFEGSFRNVGNILRIAVHAQARRKSLTLLVPATTCQTTVWVNGVLSANHVCGYTPFRLRLDNISVVKYGSPTEIAIFIDPDNGDGGGQEKGSGWWYEGVYLGIGILRHFPMSHAMPSVALCCPPFTSWY